MPEQADTERIVEELKIVRRAGLHRIGERLAELPTLVALAEQTSGGGNAEHVEALLRSVYKLRSEGAQGTAIGLLLGLEVGRRGANPTVLRKAASDRLGYYSVDTFRKRPEQQALQTFAHLIVGYCQDHQDVQNTDEARINMAMAAIQKLTMAEYAELTRRLRAWFATINTPGN